MQVKEEDVVELFKQIGVIAKIKQKFGFKDEWPWNVRLYKDGYRNKGDGTVTYEDPMAAHSAGKFFTGHKLKGSELKVEMATVKPPSEGGGGGGKGKGKDKGKGRDFGGNDGGKGKGGDDTDEGLLDRWANAKRAKDFATSDRIRDQLRAKGIDPEAQRPGGKGGGYDGGGKGKGGYDRDDDRGGGGGRYDDRRDRRDDRRDRPY